MSQYPSIIQLSDLDGANGFRLDGAAVYDYSGQAVASAGDVNGDGFADLIVGAPRGTSNGHYSGASYVVFGQASGFSAVLQLSGLDGTGGFRIKGVSEDDESGHSVASAGDVNGDGLDDLIVGANFADPDGDSSGSSYVVFGRASGFGADFELSSLNGATGFRIDGEAANDQSGFSVASAGDVNGDGFADVIVGARYADPGGDDSGASYVVFGKASGFAASLALSSLDGTNGFKLSGETFYDNSGDSVASAGDVNGDGFADLIIGAVYADPNGDYSGSSYVVFGKASGFAANIDLSSLDGTTGFKLSGEAQYDSSGVSVASAGDLNGDGFADLIVGAVYADPTGEVSGASYVVFGSDSGFAANIDLSSLDGTSGFKIDGAAAYDHSGYSVASAGDVNGDGFDDLIVAANTADANGGQSGASFVVFGKASGFSAVLQLSGLDGTNGFEIDGAAPYDRSGNSVASAGDVNGDGLDDLIVGARFADPNGLSSGSSFVIYGRLPDTAVSRTGTAADQSLVGGDLDDNLSGLDGADRLFGNGGADHLIGGKGNDVLQGGAGNDGLDGGKGSDTASYLAATSQVSVFLDLVGAQDTQGAGGDTLTSIENLWGSVFNDHLSGSSGRNALDGGVGDDVLQGGGGADALDGGAGDDLLLGGGGTDTLIGGVGIDTASYAGASAGVKVSLAIKPFQNTLSEGKDKLIGIENLTGSAFDDRLAGDNHANVLDGGAGKDVLAGANGADVFLFHVLSDSTLAATDLIADFAAGDVIDLQAIDADAGAGGDQAFHLGATPGHAGDIVVTYAHGPDRTTVSLYVDGDAVADAAIQLSGDHTGLTAADFVL